LKASVVIPTKNRVDFLRRLLCSILEQRVLPDEVIVTDDSDNMETKKLIDEFGGRFLKRAVTLRYIKPNGNEISISKARNIGARESKGEIVVFLDDDVVLDDNYFREILRVFRDNPNALGVQGLILNNQYSAFWNAVKKVFYYWHAETDRCRMLPSGKTTYALAPKKVITCEWLFGLNVAYRKEVFREFSFNEKLLGYSLGEDKEFSYKIHKKYSGSLFLTPFARAYHYPPLSKNTSKQKIYIITAYPVGFFLNNIEQTLKNKIIFLWSEMGRIVLSIIWSLPNATNIKHIIASYVDVLRNLERVKREDYSFMFDENLEG
jgi:GT2 family glycosyltransferase